MSWWGKVVGGTFGFMLGGPLGALMGVSLGNYFDGGLNAQSSRLGLGATERVQSAFFTTTFALMGYVAKSDGKVTRDEIEVAERVMSQMRLTKQQREVAVKLFNEGKRKDFPLDEILTQFRRESFRRSSLVQMLLEIVAATALADGTLHAQERRTLELIASKLESVRRASTPFLRVCRAKQALRVRTRDVLNSLRPTRSLLSILLRAWTKLSARIVAR